MNTERIIYGSFSRCKVVKFGDKDISTFSMFQNRLYSEFPDFFADPLEPSHFHITLHDLKSGTELSSLNAVMEENRIKCEKIFKDQDSSWQRHQKKKQKNFLEEEDMNEQRNFEGIEMGMEKREMQPQDPVFRSILGETAGLLSSTIIKKNYYLQEKAIERALHPGQKY